MNPFADAVGLRALHFDLRVHDFVELQEKLIRMLIKCSAVFRTPIRKNSQNRYPLVFEERKLPVIEYVETPPALCMKVNIRSKNPHVELYR